jgi:hypothetical protein
MRQPAESSAMGDTASMELETGRRGWRAGLRVVVQVQRLISRGGTSCARQPARLWAWTKRCSRTWLSTKSWHDRRVHFTAFNPLLDRSSLTIALDNPLCRPREVGHDEAAPEKQPAFVPFDLGDQQTATRHRQTSTSSISLYASSPALEEILAPWNSSVRRRSKLSFKPSILVAPIGSRVFPAPGIPITFPAQMFRDSRLGVNHTDLGNPG